jgi:hypothetical protein
MNLLPAGKVEEQSCSTITKSMVPIMYRSFNQCPASGSDKKNVKFWHRCKMKIAQFALLIQLFYESGMYLSENVLLG